MNIRSALWIISIIGSLIACKANATHPMQRTWTRPLSPLPVPLRPSVWKQPSWRHLAGTCRGTCAIHKEA